MISGSKGTLTGGEKVHLCSKWHLFEGATCKAPSELIIIPEQQERASNALQKLMIFWKKLVNFYFHIRLSREKAITVSQNFYKNGKYTYIIWRLFYFTVYLQMLSILVEWFSHLQFCQLCWPYEAKHTFSFFLFFVNCVDL